MTLNGDVALILTRRKKKNNHRKTQKDLEYNHSNSKRTTSIDECPKSSERGKMKENIACAYIFSFAVVVFIPQ